MYIDPDDYPLSRLWMATLEDLIIKGFPAVSSFLFLSFIFSALGCVWDFFMSYTYRLFFCSLLL